MKSMGFLKYPSLLLFNMFKEIELIYRSTVSSNHDKLIFDVNYSSLIDKITFVFTAKNYFHTIEDHFKSCHETKDYLVEIILPVTELYLKVRFHHSAKKCTEIIKARNLKKKLSRNQATCILKNSGL